ncbi:coil containing protein [Vibrio phage 1.158.O._10N.261.45.E12]|nr:coil containing protein [Vibrio phage 1.158.O._10N.261.45.E12]AUR92649.1 coil containing protein [Vibrio phage 1.175.O._10N.261.55.B3]
MSHFTVLVSLKEATSEALDKALQPFHEYECTGVKDEHVVFVKAEESADDLRVEYEESKSDFDCFSEFLSDNYGYIINDDGVIGRFTNPNNQWDWWVIGGRWSGKLIDKNGSQGDQFYKKDIDYDAMKSSSVQSKIGDYEKAQSAFGGELFISWQDMMKDESITRDEQRAKYHAQPAIVRFKKEFDNPFVSAEEFNMDRESFIKKSEFEGISTFAILHNGNWIEKGDMGWWGCVSDEKCLSEWQEVYEKALSEIPDDNYLIVVDCHI